MESGCYDDFNVEHLFVVDDSIWAQQIIYALKKACEVSEEFRAELNPWMESYRIANPSPKQESLPDDHVEQPICPVHLKGLSRQEKKANPEYHAFRKVAKDYVSHRIALKQKLTDLNHEYCIKSTEWNEKFNQAKLNFLNEKLVPVLKNIIPKECHSLIPMIVDDPHIRFRCDSVPWLKRENL